MTTALTQRMGVVGKVIHCQGTSYLHYVADPTLMAPLLKNAIPKGSVSWQSDPFGEI